MSDLLVSVIIPTYNRGHFIGQAIESVLRGSFTHLEVLVVDDGSTDNTEEIVQNIADTRVQYTKQTNRGRSAARNVALRRAQGAYITFLDSDDLYLPDKIKKQVNYLESELSVGMIYTSATCIDEDGVPLPHEYRATVSGNIYESIAFFQPVTITLPTVMVRREVFDKVGLFDEKMHRFEDTDMWRRISKCFVIHALDQVTCQLRTHKDNHLVNQNPLAIYRALNYYSRKVQREDRQVPGAVRRSGLSRLYRYYASAFMSVPAWKPFGFALVMHAAAASLPDASAALKRRRVQIVRAIRYRSLMKLYTFYAVIRSKLKYAARAIWYRSLMKLYTFYAVIKSRLFLR